MIVTSEQSLLWGILQSSAAYQPAWLDKNFRKRREGHTDAVCIKETDSGFFGSNGSVHLVEPQTANSPYVPSQRCRISFKAQEQCTCPLDGVLAFLESSRGS